MYLYKFEKPARNNLYLFGLIAIVFLVIVYNLFYLQIINGSKYLFETKKLSSYTLVDKADRGIIYDRNGVPLVENLPKYKIYLAKNINDDKANEILSRLETITRKELKSSYKIEKEKAKDIEYINEIKIITNLDYEPVVFQIDANPSLFDGVKIEKYIQRKYLFPELMSHIIGYTGEIDEKDYKTGKFRFGDQIGKVGLEKTLDEELRGVDGITKVELITSEGREVRNIVQPKQKGKDIYLTIDIQDQKKLYDLVQSLLKRYEKDFISIGAVTQDVKTSEIVSLISYPNFDANLFSNGISTKDYQNYLEMRGNPLANKVTQYSQSPGSTFKILTDLVSVTEKAVTPSTIYEAKGKFEYGGVTFYDAGQTNWGNIDMTRALCVSSNIYHMKTSLTLDAKTNGKASETMKKYFSAMGMDKITGINLGTESVSYYPTPADKQPWYTGNLLNASIGQGDVRTTPISLLKVPTVVANGGQYKSSIIYQGQKQIEYNPGFSTESIDAVRNGMECAGKGNTGINVSVKTGTSETGQLDTNKNEIIHGWEISYAPSEKPKYAMSIFIENGRSGAVSARISRDYYKYLLTK